ncbi:pentapeptide repeat-containing protein [Dactylosporangium sp. NPDC050688]|uniref:pentapeptide repeat-containing protein n=1 Tax=Dactylosporangium sp. NPDC050688 TaxID=3157217 RepID=UPI0033E429DB
MDAPAVDDRRGALRADCGSCFALCCVAPAFARSADFAIDKPAGHACPNLAAGGFGCGIHGDLRRRGFAGCTVYDCFGAGQQVAQVTFGGRDWRQDPASAPLMFAVFPVMRHLHELLWYLTQARDLPAAAPVHARLDDAIAGTRRLTGLPAADLTGVDVDAHRAQVVPLLREASELARAAQHRNRRPYQGRHLVGKDLRRTDLRGADLRGASAVGADLRGADLTAADVTGADLRGADLRGADLRGVLFLVQAQLDAARGDGTTRLPRAFSRPAHWPGRR